MFDIELRLPRRAVLPLCLALLVALAAPPASAQQSQGGDDEDRTHQYLLSPTRPLAECSGRVVLEAYKRYGLAGTVHAIPTDLLDTIAVGLPATIAYCNRNLAVCVKSARVFQPDIQALGEGCRRLNE
ncbi:MAG: hypothetical protein NXI16_15365 [Alphaproteobacteria bacterium]|nr:hypothetical protein [Alphaproteobacteria bacterium]